MIDKEVAVEAINALNELKHQLINDKNQKRVRKLLKYLHNECWRPIKCCEKGEIR